MTTSVATTTGVAAYLPSPTEGVLWLGPIPIRAYALCILAGIGVAIWVAGRRLVDRGGSKDDVIAVAWWAVPFGILGGRIYHVITTWQPYWGKDGHPVDALKIWDGGLGIWGAIALGALGAWIGCRRAEISFLDFADAAAPGILVAQAMGRWGNWFNNELYGDPTTVPWKLQIHEWDQSRGHAVMQDGKAVVLGYFQPTFLYESIFCLLLAILILYVDRRVILGRGRSFALYVMGYPVGRIVFELMRSDPANHILGLRVNVWMSMIIFALGLILFVWFGRRHPDGVREGVGERPDDGPDGGLDESRTGRSRGDDEAGSSETDPTT